MTVQWNATAVMAKVRQGAMQSVVRATEAVVEEGTRLILDTPKTGRVYGDHRASAPGEPPASDTGRLVQSGHAEYNTAALSGTAVWSAAEADYMEHGTSTIEPRPFARPAVANKRDEIVRDFAQDIAAALK